ncbi:Mg/Co/Ni transporter MgtE / CBS domain [hydrothermal vent metagenome]|uniref:Mg/Co/Ni transporter MgtE / CBS domain n=1 Tax=hydrothermal vent metagenome TaxID=652676 RepID=A0A1W1EKD4_9ZZZZ
MIDKENISSLHPSEIAKILRELNDDEFKSYIKDIPKDIIGDVILEMPDRYFGDMVDIVDIKDLSHAISELESDDQTDFIQELEEHDEIKAKKLFNSLDSDDQADILQLKKYNDNEAGAYMQIEVFTAKESENTDAVIKEFAKLKKSGELENVQYLFITKDNNYLTYGISLEDLLIFDFNKLVIENIEESSEDFIPIVGYDRQDIYEIVDKFKEFDLGVMPIVDENNILIGRITSDDILDIVNEQATEQMFNMAGVDDEAEEEEGIFQAGKQRAIWLSLNLLTAIMASIVIGLFSGTLESIVALAILMPIVASMGGNAGTQSLTVVVRQLALGDISSNDAIRTIKKEVILSVANGLLFAIIMGIIAYIWFNEELLGVVIALSMVINLFFAGFFGAGIPLMLKRLNIDPAIGSSVILTTVTDVVGFLSFLGLATIILL